MPHRPTCAPMRVRPIHILRENCKRTISSTSGGPIGRYNDLVKGGKLTDDKFQRGIVDKLQSLCQSIMTSQQHSKRKGGLLSFFSLDEEKPVKGLYLYGGVGSGKTMLMDMFYDTLPIKEKRRVHFHAFMQTIHKESHKIISEKGYGVDTIPYLSRMISSSAHVLCFDEFQVTDIADASLLRSLTSVLLKNSTVVMTSNRHPKDLYKNGLQRESFLPCIAALERELNVVCLDSSTDYRKRIQGSSNVYYSPLDKDATSHADHWCREWGSEEEPHSATHKIWGRPVRVPRASGKCARFTFDELCGNPLSAADYLELCRLYTAFVVENIPSLTINEKDVARRFIIFIDTAYECRAKLAITSAVPINEIFSRDDENRSTAKPGEVSLPIGHHNSGEELDPSMRAMMDDLGVSMEQLKKSSIFTGEEERFAFARALSRIYEMGGEAWQGLS